MDDREGPALIQVTQEQLLALLGADWLEPGPIHLNEALSLAELSGCLVLTHARLVLDCIDADGGVKLTQAGNFNRKFVNRMVEEFRWPGFEPEEVWELNKVLNEEDFMPLNFLHAVLHIAGLVRKYKGAYRVSRLGRALLDPQAAGRLNALLFDTTFNKYDLAYLDRWVRAGETDFQSQVALTLYLMSKFADVPRTAEEWMQGTTLPKAAPARLSSSRDGAAFQWRVLRYLQWFGLMEKQSMAANDDWMTSYLFRRTPLFDRFITFRL
jgi:hypothetical protein